ncbi:ribonuclease H-like [Mercenaria mercenaria]|uniref:ribonuclease H-like n=1 Tax=Mercenaria mercenaria TaxID=6596 RepID=UPI00234F97E9|nr:ribonuclease H-like [Mercenaria mercenaria]
MLMQVSEMETLTETNIRCIEPELTYLEFLQPSRCRPTYWNNLGSSKNRTAEQQIQARQAINQQLHDINPDAAIAFTDGSCRGNPGPCGAGSCVFLPSGERMELKQPVSKMASILLGELIAIKITLEFIVKEQTKYRIPSLHIFSDSQTVIGILTLGWENKLHIKAVQEVKSIWKASEKGGTTIKLDWSPGHAAIAGNEIADRLAKEAALQLKK